MGRADRQKRSPKTPLADLGKNILSPFVVVDHEIFGDQSPEGVQGQTSDPYFKTECDLPFGIGRPRREDLDFDLPHTRSHPQ